MAPCSGVWGWFRSMLLGLGWVWGFKFGFGDWDWGIGFLMQGLAVMIRRLQSSYIYSKRDSPFAQAARNRVPAPSQSVSFEQQIPKPADL